MREAAATLALQAPLLPAEPSWGDGGDGPARGQEGSYTPESPGLCPAKAIKTSAFEMAGEEEPGTPHEAACPIYVMGTYGRCSQVS